VANSAEHTNQRLPTSNSSVNFLLDTDSEPHQLLWAGLVRFTCVAWCVCGIDRPAIRVRQRRLAMSLQNVTGDMSTPPYSPHLRPPAGAPRGSTTCEARGAGSPLDCDDRNRLRNEKNTHVISPGAHWPQVWNTQRCRGEMALLFYWYQWSRPLFERSTCVQWCAFLNVSTFRVSNCNNVVTKSLKRSC
jgi:hypothetical protein